MIIEKKGDLLKCREDIVAHQVNCKGVMGAGVAKYIKRDILCERFITYKDFCEEHTPEFLLGKVLYIPFSKDRTRFVANLFGENIPTGKGRDTDYFALHTAFQDLRFEAETKHKSVAIPAYIGCGLAGGDWNYVFSEIIKPIFDNSPVLLYIYYLDDAIELMKKEFQEIAKKDNCVYIQEVWHGFPIGTAKKYIEEWLNSLK